MFINSIEKFSKWSSCKKCSKLFKSWHRSKLIRHEYSCDKLVKEYYPGGIYKPRKKNLNY